MAQWWSAELLDSRGMVKSTLPTVRGGRLEWSQFRSVGGTGSIDITLDSTPIDWLSDRIRILHHDGETVTPWGDWIMTAPTRETTGTLTRTTLALADKCELLNTPVGSAYTVPSGTVVTGRISTILRSVGESGVIESSPSTLPKALTWTVDDTWLTVVNDLLRSIGYASLWADRYGQLRVEPYVEPGDRPVVISYGPDDAAMLPDWSDEAPLWDVPTGFVAYTQGTESMAGMRARVDLPASHPLSAAARGRHLLRTEQVEATSTAALTTIARRRLNESVQITRRATIAHPLDSTEIGDVVTHHPAGMTGPIVQRTVTLGLGAVVEDTVRRIYTGGDTPWL